MINEKEKTKIKMNKGNLGLNNKSSHDKIIQAVRQVGIRLKEVRKSM